MDETVLFTSIVCLIIGLVVSYFIIKVAIKEALYWHSERSNYKELESKLDDIFIQLGGNPKAFMDAEIEVEGNLNKKLHYIKTSVKGVKARKIESEKAKYQSVVSIIEKKREIVKNNL